MSNTKQSKQFVENSHAESCVWICELKVLVGDT